MPNDLSIRCKSLEVAVLLEFMAYGMSGFVKISARACEFQRLYTRT